MTSHPRQRHTPPEQWNDWRWQLDNAATTVEEGGRLLQSPSSAKLHAAAERYPALVTPHYMSLATQPFEEDPVGRQFCPDPREMDTAAGKPDPLGETDCTPVPRLVRRYPDRAVLRVTDRCAVHCRHCFRKRAWRKPAETITAAELECAAAYLQAHTEIREVLVSGGDPLVLPDRELARILARLRRVANVEVIRLGSRLPVVLPQRLDKTLCQLLATYRPLWLATHFNHAREVTHEAEIACRNLLTAGVPIVNQTVLLKGINDDAAVLAELFRALVRIGVKPYYLLHADPACGAMHFRTGIRMGLEVMKRLRGSLSGLAVPVFAADLPDGGGKVVLEPQTRAGQDSDGIALYRTFDGRLVRVPDW